MREERRGRVKGCFQGLGEEMSVGVKWLRVEVVVELGYWVGRPVGVREVLCWVEWEKRGLMTWVSRERRVEGR